MHSGPDGDIFFKWKEKYQVNKTSRTVLLFVVGLRRRKILLSFQPSRASSLQPKTVSQSVELCSVIPGKNCFFRQNYFLLK